MHRLEDLIRRRVVAALQQYLEDRAPLGCQRQSPLAAYLLQLLEPLDSIHVHIATFYVI